MKQQALRHAAFQDEIARLRDDVLSVIDGDPFAEWDLSEAAEPGDIVFGLNAVERMFLSIGLFAVVSVASVLVLLMSGQAAL